MTPKEVLFIKIREKDKIERYRNDYELICEAETLLEKIKEAENRKNTFYSGTLECIRGDLKNIIACKSNAIVLTCEQCGTESYAYIKDNRVLCKKCLENETAITIGEMFKIREEKG